MSEYASSALCMSVSLSAHKWIPQGSLPFTVYTLASFSRSAHKKNHNNNERFVVSGKSTHFVSPAVAASSSSFSSSLRGVISTLIKSKRIYFFSSQFPSTIKLSVFSKCAAASSCQRLKPADFFRQTLTVTVDVPVHFPTFHIDSSSRCFSC